MNYRAGQPLWKGTGVYTRGQSPHAHGPVQEARMFRASVRFDSRIKDARVLNATSKVRRRRRTVHLEVDEVHEALVVRV